MNFQAGDIVKCINSISSDASKREFFNNNHSFLVISTFAGWVTVKGLQTLEVYPACLDYSRFEKFPITKKITVGELV